MSKPPKLDILNELRGLYQQATKERSHYYTGAVVQLAIAEIERLSDPDFITDLREFLDDQADAEYVTDDPAPRGNDAMKLLTRLNELFPEEGR